MSIGFGIAANAQSAHPATDSSITALVEGISQPLKRANTKKVIVFDFRGANEQVHPVGKWLADQVSMTIQKELPKIKAIDRSQLNPKSGIAEASTDPHLIFVAEINEARALGADVFISGTFARVSDQIGVSVEITKIADRGQTLEVRTGLVPISRAITDLSSEPIPGLDLKDGIPHAGIGGISMPICTRCPAPETPRNATKRGVVLLEIVVTPDGRPEKITIIKTPSPELADSAVRTVQSWRFKPAIGFDGSAIAVFTPIEVTFQ
jgi:TonB family protein